ncbi:nuclear factor NF-kappa-B p100 subunit isoform X2 [Cephus cinctus]|uniref:Nuclear factor NF-kappa-B p100 subunit isoform X2 n=1 Tax=Cephus cinctus TaxID=211228 RepID=A0AAJ7BPZ3_CEPCN|nr:nuclear factor NF-kappa-B p100 subunit isoform X2 [Cephus cinctus]
MPEVCENFETLQNIIGEPSNLYPYSYGLNMNILSPSHSSTDSQGTSSSASPMSVSSSPFHITNYITLNNATVMGNPQLRIVVQPVDKFRFRYRSEMMGTHGSLLGASSTSNRKKQAPSVELLNYPGRAVIRCTLVTSDQTQRIPHAHHLVRREDNNDRDDPYEIEVSQEKGYIASFQGMGIIHTAKKHIKDELITKMKLEALEKARRSNVDANLTIREETQIKMDAEAAQKNMNLNSVALRFEALYYGQNDVLVPLTKPVYSNPINNLKSALTGELKICRIDKCTSSCDGNEEVFLLVEKVGKKNIRIKFFEVDDDDKMIWCDYGQFSELDVHHQYAIVFRTPAYRDREITTQKEVFLQLERPSDGDCSDPIKFTYKPSDKMKNRKRLRSSYSGSAELFPSTLPRTNDIFASSDLFPINTNGISSHELEKLIYADDCNSEEFKDYCKNINLDIYCQTLPSNDVTMNTSGMETQLTVDGPAAELPRDDVNFCKSIFLQIVNTSKKEPLKLKEKCITLLKERTAYGDSPLHSALRHGQIEIIKYILLLLDSDADYKALVDAQNSSGKTPLHYAVIQNQVAVTKALLMLGADPNICDDRGVSPLHAAVKVPEAGICVDALLTKNVNIEARDDAGWRPIQLAAEAGSLHAVKSLINASADVNSIEMCYGRTALHIAVEGGHKSIVEFLLKETNIDVNKGNFNGNTALHSAVVNTGTRAKELCELLIKYGADPSIANHHRKSIKEGDVSVKREVTSDDEDADDENGQTSFDLARNKPDLYQVLSGEGMDQSETSKAVHVKQEVIENWPNTNEILRLASILDKTQGWKQLIERLDYGFLLSTLREKHISPSLTILNYADLQGDISIQYLREILKSLNEKEAVVVIDEILSKR